MMQRINDDDGYHHHSSYSTIPMDRAVSGAQNDWVYRSGHAHELQRAELVQADRAREQRESEMNHRG